MLNAGDAGAAELGGILVRSERSDAERTTLLPSSPECVTTAADEFFAADWGLCIEAAGQPAVLEHGKRCLGLGRDFMVTSIGALTDAALYDELAAVAQASGSRLILCTGSMPGVDWMGAAAMAGCGAVSVTQTKPPKAWLGTPAEAENPDLLELTELRTLFEGSAREAASLYPKNANVTAMLALATAGLDATVAKLVADPAASGNLVHLSFEGPAGKISVDVQAVRCIHTPARPRPTD